MLQFHWSREPSSFCRVKTERDEFVGDVRRLEESLKDQEHLNKQLQIKEIESKATIKHISQQLEETLNKLHDIQATSKK